MRSPVAREGIPFILGFAAVAAAGTWGVQQPVLSAVLWLLTGWCVWFFRDPDREPTSEEGVILAPADGKVVVIEEVAAAPLTGLPARKFSIFMNVFSVHVNRSPEKGVVRALSYHPGKFLNAALDKASVENERMAYHLELADGTPIVFVQVAGLVARRIVCRIAEGARLERGERFGLIRFGSRVDVYLPLSAQIVPVLGEQTTAGETIIARLEKKRG